MLDGLWDTVKSAFSAFIDYTIWGIFYGLEALMLKIISYIEGVVMIFTGEQEILYNDRSTALIDIFFYNKVVRGIYSGMAVIGISFAFIFAIYAVIKRSLDLRGKQQGVTLGSILGNLLKSILLIFGMNAVIMLSLTTTNILMKEISTAVKKGVGVAQGPVSITFTNEQYAAMGRIINTLGNYSLNPSYRSRYNVNSCYNDIRADLQYLGELGMFDFHYVTKDKKGNTIDTWQSVIEKLANAHDYRYEVAIDVYDDAVSKAVLDAIDTLKVNPSMKVLEYYEREEIKAEDTNIPIDRILFLAGTMGTYGDNAAARNSQYNQNPSFFDNVRLPFYLGEKSIYDYEEVREFFNPSPMHTNYAVVYAAGLGTLQEMLVILITCAVRIFNLLALYLAAPIVISAMPLDDGGKLKQWSTAFIVQLLSVVGMVLSMRLFLMFLPIIWNPKLVLANNALVSVILKAVLMYAGLESVNKVNGIFTGILADNAGYQAITAGDMRSGFSNSAIGKALGGASIGSAAGAVGGAIGGAAGGMAKKAGGKVADATGLSRVGRAVRRAGEAIGAVKQQDEKNMSPEMKQEKERSRQRDMQSYKRDLDHAKETGEHLNGKRLKEGELSKMESTYGHMKDGGHTLSEAKSLADIDARSDRADLAAEERDSNLTKTPPPDRAKPAPPLPGNQNNQV